MNSTEQFNDNFIVYAHRGASSYAPQNTMAAFNKALEQGANGIECDLRETKDGIIVISHDDEINKTSNGTGKISDLTYEELLKYDFGSYFSEEFKGEKIVKFEDFAKEFLNKKMTFAIELKSNNIEKKVLNIINKYKTHNNIYITSFSYEILKNIRFLSKDVKIGWLIDKITQEKIDNIKQINGQQLCPHAEKTTKQDIGLAKQNNISVRLWGVKNEEIMNNAYKLEIEGMTVNFPDLLIQLVKDTKQNI